MEMAGTLRRYLTREGVDYEVVEHPYAGDSMRVGAAAHVAGATLAKAVLLEDEDGYLLAALPATQHLQLGRVHHLLERRMGLATADELRDLFTDCEDGAVPALGLAYGIEMLVDDALLTSKEVYIEAGDHRHLIHLSGESFRRLLDTVAHGKLTGRGD